MAAQLGWYSEEQPGTVSFLRAGPLDLTLEGVDLRWIGLGPDEIVRRVGVAVRNESWATIPPEISQVNLERRDRSFTLRFHSSHRSGDLHFDWDGEVSGGDDGTINYLLEGVCLSAFRYNRVGICVLHPLTLAGANYTARTAESEIRGTLPRTIEPQRIEDGTIYPLFQAFDRLVLDSAIGRIGFEFEGDMFETEDQRNWTDASFKTYSTPLALGWPRDAVAGQRIVQRLNMRLDPVIGHGSRRRRTGPVPVEITLGADTGRALPPIGLGLSSDREGLGAEVESVRLAGPAHVRVDLDGASASWPVELARAQREATALDAGLEAAVLCEKDLGLIDELGLLPAGFLRRVIVLSTGWPPADALVGHVRERLPAGVEVCAGTDSHFVELNRGLRASSSADSLCYPISPQAHASDDASIVETLEAQGQTVKAAELLGRLPVVVSPVTLRPRTPLRAAGGAPRTPVDARQHSAFCAAWTVASIKQLAEAGAKSLTYFETVGLRGVVPRLGLAPVARALAELSALQHATVVASHTDFPLAIQTLALRDGTGIVLFVINVSCAVRHAVVAPAGQLVELAPYEMRRLELAT